MENIAETTERRHSRAEASSSRRTPKREIFGPHYIGRREAFCRPGWCCSSARPSTRLCLPLFLAFAEPTSRTCRRPRLRKSTLPRDATSGKLARRPATLRSRSTRGTRMPARSAADKHRKSRRPSASAARESCIAGYDHAEQSGRSDSRLRSSRIDVLVFTGLGSETQIVHEESNQSANHRHIAEPLQRALPYLYGPRNARIGRQTAVKLRLAGVVQHVDHASPADARRIINSCLREIVMFAKLFRALLREVLHVIFAAEMQAACWTRFDARRLQSFAHAVRAQGALEDAVRFRIHLRNIEGTARDAVAAANAVGLLKINNAVGVLHDGAIGGARSKASRLRAVHALILPHQPHERAVVLLMLVEKNQVPIIPARFRHRLIGVVEHRFAEGQIVPLHAGNFASFAADASCGIDKFADGVFALGLLAGNTAGVPGNFLNA